MDITISKNKTTHIYTIEFKIYDDSGDFDYHLEGDGKERLKHFDTKLYNTGTTKGTIDTLVGNLLIGKKSFKRNGSRVRLVRYTTSTIMDSYICFANVYYSLFPNGRDSIEKLVKKFHIRNANSILSNKINEYPFHFMEQILTVLLEHDPFLSLENRVDGGIINPYTDRIFKLLNKRAKTATAKKLFGKMILKKVSYKPLSNFDNVNYDIEENCVRDYFKTVHNYESDYDEYNFKIVKDICKKINYNIYAHAISGYMIDQYENCKSVGSIHCVLHNEHLYIINQKKHNLKNIVMDDKEIDVLKKKNIRYFVDDKEKYDEIFENAQKKYDMCGYTDYSFNVNNNIIIYDEKIKQHMKLIDKIGSRTKAVYNALDKYFGFRGFLNHDAYDFFYKHVPNCVRHYKYSETKSNIIYDMNKAYCTFYKDEQLEFPVPVISDKWEKYNDTPINSMTFYYIETDEFDPILLPTKYNVVCGNVLFTMEEYNIKYKILYMFHCSSSSHGMDCSFIDPMDIKYYNGWLNKNDYTYDTYYNNISDDEFIALNRIHRDCVYPTKDENIFRIAENKPNVRTGRLAYIFVSQMTNIILFKFHKEFAKLNKKFILNSINTDEIGYIVHKLPKNPKSVIDIKYKDAYEHWGKFKIKKEYEPKDEEEIKSIYEIPHSRLKNPVMNYNVNTYTSKNGDMTNIYEKLKNHEGFFMNGIGGVGKTYIIDNVIIPYLKEHGMKYFCCGTTIENSFPFIRGDKECTHTIQKIFTKKCDGQLHDFFNKYQYLIIDEATQLSQGILKKLEYVKYKTHCKIIFVGDIYQCKAIDAPVKTWLSYPVILQLCDGNQINIEKDHNERYDDKTYAIIKQLIKNYGNEGKMVEIIKKNFQKDNKVRNINIAYYNKTCDTINDMYLDDFKKMYEKKLGFEIDCDNFKQLRRITTSRGNKDLFGCFTVHKAQGKTIDKPHSIYDIERMPADVLFTSITRAKRWSDIYIVK